MRKRLAASCPVGGIMSIASCAVPQLASVGLVHEPYGCATDANCGPAQLAMLMIPPTGHEAARRFRIHPSRFRENGTRGPVRPDSVLRHKRRTGPCPRLVQDQFGPFAIITIEVRIGMPNGHRCGLPAISQGEGSN